jgi:hypothetical protein
MNPATDDRDGLFFVHLYQKLIGLQVEMQVGLKEVM